MKNKLLSAILASMFFVVSHSSDAGIIDYGSLSLGQVGDTYVTDTLNNVEWLRWDQVDHLNYSQLIIELGAGGTYEGWTIANNDYANKFTNALFSSSGSTCDSVTAGTICATPFDYAKFVQLIGNTFDGQAGTNYAWFDSANGRGQEVGLLSALDDQNKFGKANEWTSLANTDAYSDTGINSHVPMGALLYKANAVPEPSTFAIFALGMIGLTSRRFKK
jgi:hypothetical protein